MRMYLLPVLAILTVSSFGCGPRPAMTASEFKGFCYQSGGHDEGDCDNIAMCDTYMAVIGTPQDSLQQCLQGCIDINRKNIYQTISSEAINVSQTGMDYCQRYCRSVYTK